MRDLRDKIEYIGIDDIKPYNGSHNTDDTVKLLKESIEKFGIQQPIIVDKNKVVVAGNAIYKAAKELGYPEIPCLLVDDLTDEEVAQYRIADNKTSEFASWNEKKLKKEISYLENINDLQFCFDENLLSMVGFSDDTIKPIESKSSFISGKSENETPISVQLEREKVAQEKQVKEEERFNSSLKNVEAELVAKPREYLEIPCSKCGRTIRIKV